MKVIIKGGKVIDGSSDKEPVQDIYINNGLICSPFDMDGQTKVISGKNKYILPGLVDLHVHFRDPGQTYKEDITSGSMAAARGGFTTVCCMPNTVPVVDSASTLEYVDRQGEKAGYVNLLTVSSMTENQAGLKLCDFKTLDSTPTLSTKLTGHGICGISEDGRSLSDLSLMSQVCYGAKELGIPIMDHAEPEVEMIYRDIELSKKTNCKIHVQHISKAHSVKLIREAKADGISVTCEAAPHHFALNKSAVDIYGTDAKMNPPLGDEKDRIAVIEGLLDDTIDIIATDHAPHTQSEKNVDFAHAPNGISGLETAFPVSYTLLAKSGLMSFNRLVYKMSVRPLEIIGGKPTKLVQGEPADLCLIDTSRPFIIDRENFVSKGKNTPFHGMEVHGKVELTIHNGKITWRI